MKYNILIYILLYSSIIFCQSNKIDTNYYREYKDYSNELINTSIESIESFNTKGSLHGPWIKYFRDGNIKVMGNYVNGRKNGLWKYYDYARYTYQLIEKSNYLNGKLHGTFISYYLGEDSLIKSTGEYIEGKKNGYWKYYSNDYGSSKLDSSGTYINGLKQGEWIYYENEKISSKGNFSNNNKIGVWKYFSYGINWYDDSDTLVSYGKYKDNFKIGIWIEYDEKNAHMIKKIGKYNIGLRDSIWKTYTYNESYMLDSGRYINGKKEGFWRIESMNSHILYGQYKNNNKTGVWYTLDGNDTIEKGNYLNNERNGEWAFYNKYEDQDIYSNINYWKGYQLGKFSKTINDILIADGVILFDTNNVNIDKNINARILINNYYSNGQIKEIIKGEKQLSIGDSYSSLNKEEKKIYNERGELEYVIYYRPIPKDHTYKKDTYKKDTIFIQHLPLKFNGIKQFTNYINKNYTRKNGKIEIRFSNEKIAFSGKIKDNKPIGYWNEFDVNSKKYRTYNFNEKSNNTFYQRTYSTIGNIMSEGFIIDTLLEFRDDYSTEKSNQKRVLLKTDLWFYYNKYGELKKIINYQRKDFISQLFDFPLEEYYYDDIEDIKDHQYPYVTWTKTNKKNEFVSHYDNDTISSKGKFINSKMYGYWQFYSRNGNIKAEGMFNDNGYQIGQWKYYNKEGKNTLTENYNKKGELHGKQYEYDYWNNDTNITQYKNGKEQFENGSYHDESEQDESITDGTYKKNKKIGEWITTSIYDDDKRIEYYNKKGRLDSIYTTNYDFYYRTIYNYNIYIYIVFLH